MDFLLKNARVINLDPPKIEEADIRIIDGVIADRGKNYDQRKVKKLLIFLENIFFPDL